MVTGEHPHQTAGTVTALPAAPAGHVIALEGHGLDGQTVTVRHHLSFAAETRIDESAYDIRMSAGAGDARFASTTLAHASAVIAECVLSWTLLDVRGERLPCDPSVVRDERCPRRIRHVIDAVVDHYADDGGDGADPTG